MLLVTSSGKKKRPQGLVSGLLFIFLFSLPLFAWASDEQAGQVLFAKGAVTAKLQDEEVRFLGKGERFFEGDVLTTGPRSFALIQLTDGGRMTLRPDTVFGLEKYAHGGGRENAIMRLFRGGLRALTGLIGKRNPQRGYTLNTPVATIGIRGTEFDARLCMVQDCAKEEQKYKKVGAQAQSPVVGRVAYIRGTLKASTKDGKARQVFTGGPVYQGDTLLTGPAGLAVLAFRDHSRVTLRADTRFMVESYQYGTEKQDNILFRLFKGGLRTLTGLLAKRSPRAVKIATPVATIGIRGTGFDLQLCEQNCAGGVQGLAPQDASTANGMFVVVWDEGIELHLPDPPDGPGGAVFLGKNDPVFVPGDGGKPVHLPAIPVFMLQDPDYRPDRLKDIDLDNLFATKVQDETLAGLYVNVYDGHVRLTTDIAGIDLGIGEAGYAGSRDGKPIRLAGQPLFLVDGPLPKPGKFDETVRKVLEFMIEESGGPGGSREFECEIR